MKSLSGLLILFSLFSTLSCQQSGSSREPASVSSDELKGGEFRLRRLPVINAGTDINVEDSDGNGSQIVKLSGVVVSSRFPVTKYNLYRNDVLISSGADKTIFQSQQLVPVGSYEFTMEAVNTRGLIGTDSVIVTVRPQQVVVNTAPMVNAGADIVKVDADNNGSESVTLAGSASDAQNNITSYKVFRNGVQVASSLTASIVVPVGTHSIVMEAYDIGGLKGSDTMVITVNRPPVVNTAPVVNAGADMVLTDGNNSGNETVALKGSASDAQNNIVSYRVLRNNVQIATSLTASVTLPLGQNALVMEATDAGGLKGTDTVIITVNAPVVTNTAPVVNAGADMVLTDANNSKNETIALKGSASDAQNNISSYRVLLDGVQVATSLTASITVPLGQHTVLMEATDAGGLKGSDSLSITVNAPAVTNTAPVVNAGADVAKTDADKNGSEVIALMGSATDAQNNISSYRVLLDGVQVATSLTASITVPVGSHTVMMEATDAGGLKGSDSLMVNVTAPVVQGAGPVANAGPDITHQNDDHDGDVGESSGVETLSITTSATPGANPLASWIIKVNSVVYARGNTFPIPAQKFHFIKGTNLLTLEVTDTAGVMSSDNATVLVKPGLDDNKYGGGTEIKPGIISVSAGGQRILIDKDGDGFEPITMTGAVTAVNPVVDYKWIYKGQIIAQGTSPSILTTKLNLPLGVNRVSLTVTDSAGNTVKDGIEVTVSAAFQEQLPSIPTDPTLVANNLVNASFTGTNHWKDQSAFRFRCEASHIAYDDPIVFPGQPGKAHLHMFYGNTLANGNSTYQSLRSTGAGSCDGGPLNRTAYWMPAVLNQNNKVVVPDMVTIYYKKYPGTHRIPRGLKMIFGYDHKNPKTTNVWKCSHGDTTLKNTFAAVNCPATLSNGNNKIMATLAALECWDGKNLDSPDHRSHMAACVRDNNWGNCSCPATHPVSIPHFTLLVSWTHNGYSEYSQWRLSSDHVSPHDSTSTPLPGGSTFHADWFGAWDDDVMDRWIDGCIGQFKNCSAGDTGTGKRLKEVPGFTFGIDPTKRLIDPPTSPTTAKPIP